MMSELAHLIQNPVKGEITVQNVSVEQVTDALAATLGLDHINKRLERSVPGISVMNAMLGFLPGDETTHLSNVEKTHPLLVVIRGLRVPEYTVLDDYLMQIDPRRIHEIPEEWVDLVKGKIEQQVQNISLQNRSRRGWFGRILEVAAHSPLWR